MAKKFGDKLMEDIASKVEDMVQGDTWKDMLDVMSRFHQYSFRNIMLILDTKPDATRVAGYKTWGEMNRRPKKGSAIWILGYRSGEREERNDETGEVEKKRWVSFPPVKVFDIGDTYLINPELGDPINDADQSIAPRLEGEGDGEVFDSVVGFLEGLGWTVEFGDCGSANGRTMLDESKRVLIAKGMSDKQNLKTLIHEAAHVLLHSNEQGSRDSSGLVEEYGEGKFQSLLEIEAESVAYTVAKSVGIDTSGYSIGYIAGWSGGDTDLVMKVGERVAKALKSILDVIKKDL